MVINDKHLFNNIENLQEKLFKQGQKVLYEGKDAQIVKVKPFIVIKTGEIVVCGALHKLLRVSE